MAIKNQNNNNVYIFTFVDFLRFRFNVAKCEINILYISIYVILRAQIICEMYYKSWTCYEVVEVMDREMYSRQQNC